MFDMFYVIPECFAHTLETFIYFQIPDFFSESQSHPQAQKSNIFMYSDTSHLTLRAAGVVLNMIGTAKPLYLLNVLL